uniref:Uncharacterized protein n=1 Tax=Romanomermis culicivorax TaxID=13658 RepID=A0A915L2Z0_ROMCU
MPPRSIEESAATARIQSSAARAPPMNIDCCNDYGIVADHSLGLSTLYHCHTNTGHKLTLPPPMMFLEVSATYPLSNARASPGAHPLPGMKQCEKSAINWVF